MNIKTFLNKLLKVLPGFRTGKKPNQVIAIIYYLLCLVVLTAGVGYSLFMISLPFIVFSAVGLLKDKNKIHAIWLIAAIFIFIVGVWVTPQTDKTASSNKVSVSSKSTLNSNKSDSKAAKTTKDTDKSSDIKMTNTVTNTDKTVAGQLKIHYIDVGQGDSILIQQGSQNMLIDTGTNASTNSLMSYLQSQNIKKIDVLVLTHPHEDHIGGADAVIKGFDIGTLYMNKVTTTTKTYEDAIKAISSKGLKPIEPTSGTTFNLGNATCTVLSPINSSYKDLNTYSIVIKMTFGNNKFLFTGDTQASNEQDMINKGYDLSADVLKIAHHGSDTSTSQAFLDKVNPKYAVISVGKGNDYKHPHEQTMDKLKAKNISVYRTDENGTIIATSDGKNISFNTKIGDYSYGAVGKEDSSSNSNNSTASTNNNTSPSVSTPSPVIPKTAPEKPSTQPSKSITNNERTVYYTPNGKSYHYDKNCSTLSRSKTILSGKLSEVINSGKSDPCDKCVK